jgi:hypothetical protein
MYFMNSSKVTAQGAVSMDTNNQSFGRQLLNKTIKQIAVAIVLIVSISLPKLINAQSLTMDILVVGGGGGAGYARGGGGGGGGYLYNANYAYTGGSTAITVGTGGAKGTAPATGTNYGVHALSGTNSSFGTTFVAIGGGGGGSYEGGPQNGYAGGSGGGGANQSSSANTGFGGAGTAGQGFAGGNSRLSLIHI